MFPCWPKAKLPGLCLALFQALVPALILPASPRSAPVPAEATASVQADLRPAPAAEGAIAPLAAPAAPAAQPARPRAATPTADPFLAAMLGAMPLMSGFYLTSTPQKGAVFTLADAMLIGTIITIRSDENIPPKDVAVYYYLLGAVNVADLALSVMQARSDAASRLSIHLNPPDKPGFLLGWRF